MNNYLEPITEVDNTDIIFTRIETIMMKYLTPIGVSIYMEYPNIYQQSIDDCFSISITSDYNHLIEYFYFDYQKLKNGTDIEFVAEVNFIIGAMNFWLDKTIEKYETYN